MKTHLETFKRANVIERSNITLNMHNKIYRLLNEKKTKIILIPPNIDKRIEHSESLDIKLNVYECDKLIKKIVCLN